MNETGRSGLILAVAALLSEGVAAAGEGGISAKQEDDKLKTIRVVAPGKFETTFNMRKGFVGKFFDLAHDPGKKRDLAPVADENGILWTKNGFPEGVTNGSYYANPPTEMKLLEAGPARVRVRLTGPHARYGKTAAKGRWPKLGFRQTWTVYPSGQAYCDYALVNDKPIKLHHFLLIVKSTGHWGPRGKGEGKGEVHPASERGNDKRPTGRDKSSFVLQWSNGPTHFMDMLLVLHAGRYGGTYWNEGFQDKDYRTGLNVLGRWKDATVPGGGDHVALMMRFDRDLNGADAARPHAADYRSPDKPDVLKGKLVTTDPGDHDADGFNESEGCYVLAADREAGASLKLHGKKTPRMDPAFKITGWPGGGLPGAVTVDGKALAAGKGYNAAVNGDVLLVQLLGRVTDDVTVKVLAVTAPAK